MIIEEIKKVMGDLVSLGATPGINYAVIKDKNKYIGSLGLKSQYVLDNDSLKLAPEENDINTLYDLASLTKVICILPIIFRLKERGKISLNDKVKMYLKDFKYNNITIYDLLTHQSGLYPKIDNNKITTKEEIIKKVYSLEQRDEVGTFVYSDIGYILLGLIIEKIYNKSLDEIFKEEVAIPLEMKNTTFNPKQKDLTASTEVTIKRGVVRGIVHDEKACSMNGIAGNAGLFSNIKDLINFSTMILNKGKFKRKKYLDEKTIEMWFTSLVRYNNYNHSFCWFVGNNPNIIEQNEENVISFHGFTGPSISIDMKNNIIIIMLTNRIHPTRDSKLNTKLRPQITKKIYDIVINEKISS